MSRHRIAIENTAEHFDAPAERTVLDAAHEAFVPLASSCRTGTCRTCIRRLRSGTVRYEVPWPGLSPDEKQEGFFLPCVAFATSDLVIGGDGVKPWWEG
ncbi:2Fe-2S iron-sulfur cluster-binding protein [Ramlibacter sp.]|uniref:2Fe-2S iron-sulfur cluster-binding protein n=1 Tax=Ramlibacter sp. TaxID=1917967 RepID=UPI003D1531CC